MPLDLPEEQLKKLSFFSAKQDPEECLRRVKERFGNALDEISYNLSHSMASIINDEYCGCNPKARQPFQNVNYQEDTGAIVFEFDGESIYLEPVWVPVHYKSYEKFPENYKQLQKVNIQDINPIKSKYMYTAGDYYFEKTKEKEQLELEKMSPSEYNALPEYKKKLLKLESKFN